MINTKYIKEIEKQYIHFERLINCENLNCEITLFIPFDIGIFENFNFIINHKKQELIFKTINTHFNFNFHSIDHYFNCEMDFKEVILLFKEDNKTKLKKQLLKIYKDFESKELNNEN